MGKSITSILGTLGMIHMGIQLKAKISWISQNFEIKYIIQGNYMQVHVQLSKYNSSVQLHVVHHYIRYNREPWTSTNACRHICRYVDRKGLAAMLTSIQSAGVAPEVNLRNSLHIGDKARKRGIHPGFETQGRHCQKSKTEVSVAPRKGLMSSKI